MVVNAYSARRRASPSHPPRVRSRRRSTTGPMVRARSRRQQRAAARLWVMSQDRHVAGVSQVPSTPALPARRRASYRTNPSRAPRCFLSATALDWPFPDALAGKVLTRRVVWHRLPGSIPTVRSTTSYRCARGPMAAATRRHSSGSGRALPPGRSTSTRRAGASSESPRALVEQRREKGGARSARRASPRPGSDGAPCRQESADPGTDDPDTPRRRRVRRCVHSSGLPHAFGSCQDSPLGSRASASFGPQLPRV